MKKFSLLISTLLLTATLVFTLSGFLSPQTAYAQAESGSSSESNPCSAIMLIPGNGEGAAKCFGHLVATGLGEQAVKFSGSVIIDALGWVSVLLLQFFNLILGLGGVVLNLVVGYTVVHMADNIKAIGVIDNAWQTIRDVANMGFIFILLYASIQLILGIGKDVQRLIVNIIIVAVLINFSLFFTKLVIDVSNVMAVTFYGAMAPEALDVGTADILGFDTDLSKKAGLANSMMEPLKLNSIFDAVKTPALDSNSLIIIGVAGSILALVAAFVFFAISIMLIIRFVVLIFVMILSPIAFMAMILPTLNTYSKQWWQALSGQAFFAPIYFMLTWIVIQLARGLPSWGGGTLATAFLGEQSTVTVNGVVQQVPTMSLGGIGILMNFIIIIAFLLASLMISKEWAGKAGGGIKSLTKWATGAAGNASFGLAGRVGRGSLGRLAEARTNNQDLLDRSKEKGMSGRLARLQLAAAHKTAGASFDMRATSVTKQLDAGKAGGKGGFAKFKEEQAKEAEKRAKALAPKAEVIDQAKQDLEKHSVGDEKTTKRLEEERQTEQKRHTKRIKRLQKKRQKMEAGGASEYKLREIDDRIAESQAVVNSTSDVNTYAKARVERLEGVKKKGEIDRRKKSDIENDPRSKRVNELEEQLQKKREELNNAVLEETKAALTTEIENINREIETAKVDADKAKSEIENEYKERERRGEFAGAGERRKRGYANVVENSFWGKKRGYNTAAAAKIRGGKSTKDQLAELAKKSIKEDEEDEGGAGKGEESGETAKKSEAK